MKIITHSYLSLLNSFLFLSRFSVSLKSLNNYFFKRFAYKSILNRFSVLINYIMWSSNHFSTSSCFLRFLGSKIFRVQVFQGLGPGSGSRFQKQPQNTRFNFIQIDDCNIIQDYQSKIVNHSIFLRLCFFLYILYLL